MHFSDPLGMRKFIGISSFSQTGAKFNFG